MTYCFTCRECGYRVESNVREPVPTCSRALHGSVVMQRDYRAENAAPQTFGLKREREAGGRRAMRDAILPTVEDFKSPEDPDGEKGLRAWADETKPKEGNKNPLWPDMKKKVFSVG